MSHPLSEEPEVATFLKAQWISSFFVGDAPDLSTPIPSSPSHMHFVGAAHGGRVMVALGGSIMPVLRGNGGPGIPVVCALRFFFFSPVWVLSGKCQVQCQQGAAKSMVLALQFCPILRVRGGVGVGVDPRHTVYLGGICQTPGPCTVAVSK